MAVSGIGQSLPAEEYTKKVMEVLIKEMEITTKCVVAKGSHLSV
jgi:hypothetical protein